MDLDSLTEESEKCIDVYSKLFPDDDCFYAEPSDLILIDTDDNAYIQPFDETEETFYDRIERCKKEIFLSKNGK